MKQDLQRPIIPDITLNLFIYLYLLIIKLYRVFFFKILSSWVFILQRKKFNTHNNVEQGLPNQIHVHTRKLPVPVYPPQRKRKNHAQITSNCILHIIISIKSCQVRLYKIFPDITLNLVSNLYFLINYRYIPDFFQNSGK